MSLNAVALAIVDKAGVQRAHGCAAGVTACLIIPAVIDLAQRVELSVGGDRQLGADVVAEAEVAGALGAPSLAVLLGGTAQLVIVEPGAGEVTLLAARAPMSGKGA